jgi:bifunctional NMN adenylyltransferase/nudix hydrolase
MTYDYLIFIGRFQPFHNGHKYVIQEGLKISKNIIIICGSANQMISTKNPFTYEERKYCILSDFDYVIAKRLHVEPLDNHKCDDVWSSNLKQKVNIIAKTNNKNAIGIIGHNKDDSSYYLKLFQDWHNVEVGNFQQIDATYIRKVIFTAKDTEDIKHKIADIVPEKTLLFLCDFLNSKRHLELKKSTQPLFYSNLRDKK